MLVARLTGCLGVAANPDPDPNPNPNWLAGGCRSMSKVVAGRLQTKQKGAGTYFEVKLATEPQNGSLVAQ